MTTKEARPSRDEAHAEWIRQVTIVMARLGLNQSGLAEYLGVPQSTVNNWFTGIRQPNKSVTRLLYVLGVVETMAPNIHAHLMPRPKGPANVKGHG